MAFGGQVEAILIVGVSPDLTKQARPFLEGKAGDFRPGIAADRQRMATLVIAAIDQKPAHAGRAHLGEGDLLGAIGHRP